MRVCGCGGPLQQSLDLPFDLFPAYQGAQGPAAVRCFLSAYPDAVRIALEQNYRSSGAIVSAATAVAANNRTRCDKKVRSSIFS